MLDEPNQENKLSQEELLSWRSKRSRGRGRGFEDAVVKKLRKLGYDPKKKVLSGGNLAKPYDVGVRPFRLKIEAKRRMGNGIVIEGKWLDKVAPKYVVVFAAGPRLGKDAKMCSISQGEGWTNLYEMPITGKSKKVGVVDGKFAIKRGAPHPTLVIDPPFLILYRGKKFIVQDFETYMKQNWAQFAKGETKDAREN